MRTPIDPVVETLDLMRQHGVEIRQVPGYKRGFCLPVPATMEPQQWWGILELTCNPEFLKVGGFSEADQQRIAAEHEHWLSLTGQGVPA